MKKKKEWKPQYRKFVRELVGDLQWRLFITNYSIDVSYAKDDKAEKESKDNCVAADIKTDHRYYTAYITIYPNTHLMWDNGKKREVANVVVHEICHILTDPLYKLTVDSVTNTSHKFHEDLREQITQQLANIVMAYLEKDKPKLVGL